MTLNNSATETLSKRKFTEEEAIKLVQGLRIVLGEESLSLRSMSYFLPGSWVMEKEGEFYIIRRGGFRQGF